MMKTFGRVVLLMCGSVAATAQNAASYLKLADSQAKSGQYRQAVGSLQKAIAADPNNAQAYDKLGDVYGRMNMPSESAAAYEKSADLLAGAPALPATPAVRAEAPAPRAMEAPAAPAMARGGGGGGLDGLYLMTRFWMGSGLEVATYRFHDGIVIRNPVGSAKGIDLAAERAMQANNVGTYRLQAGQLTLAFPGSNQPARFEPGTGGCFNWNTATFCPVEVFKPGTTLDGSFEGGASVGGGAVMSSMTITFRRDGSYQRNGAASFSSQGRNSGASGGGTSSERGRYRIDGTALTLMPDGGPQTVVSTFPYDDGSTGPEPHSVYFGGGMLKRIK